jgi:hypothetical protein
MREDTTRAVVVDGKDSLQEVREMVCTLERTSAPFWTNLTGERVGLGDMEMETLAAEDMLTRLK